MVIPCRDQTEPVAEPYEKDITLNGLEAVKKCGKVYLEMYTSILGVPKVGGGGGAISTPAS